MNGLIHSVSFFLVLVYCFSYFAYRSPGYGGEDLGGAFYLSSISSLSPLLSCISSGLLLLFSFASVFFLPVYV